MKNFKNIFLKEKVKPLPIFCPMAFGTEFCRKIDTKVKNFGLCLILVALNLNFKSKWVF